MGVLKRIDLSSRFDNFRTVRVSSLAVVPKKTYSYDLYNFIFVLICIGEKVLSKCSLYEESLKISNGTNTCSDVSRI